MEKKIEDTLAKKYSNSMEKINLEIHESQLNFSSINMKKTTPRLIIIKLTKSKITVKAVRGGEKMYYIQENDDKNDC